MHFHWFTLSAYHNYSQEWWTSFVWGLFFPPAFQEVKFGKMFRFPRSSFRHWKWFLTAGVTAVPPASRGVDLFLEYPATQWSRCSVRTVLIVCEVHSRSWARRRQETQCEQRWCASGETAVKISVTLQNCPIWWKTRSLHWCVMVEHPFSICRTVRTERICQRSENRTRHVFGSFQLWEPQAGSCLFTGF